MAIVHDRPIRTPNTLPDVNIRFVFLVIYEKDETSDNSPLFSYTGYNLYYFEYF